jgi:hypothetical protein
MNTRAREAPFFQVYVTKIRQGCPTALADEVRRQEQVTANL